MSEQIVREASAWQGTIEGDYRESAQIFGLAPSKVFIRRRPHLNPSSFWQGCPELANIQPDTCQIARRTARLKSPRDFLDDFYEHYFR